MDIAALSVGLSQMKVSQAVGISVLKMAMDTAQGQTNDLSAMMEQSVAPHLGSSIDISL